VSWKNKHNIIKSCETDREDLVRPRLQCCPRAPRSQHDVPLPFPIIIIILFPDDNDNNNNNSIGKPGGGGGGGDPFIY